MDNLRDEFKNLVDELLIVRDEARESEISEKLDRISPDPEWSDYIFWSDDYRAEDGNIDLEQLAEKVFSYKPIQL